MNAFHCIAVMATFAIGALATTAGAQSPRTVESPLTQAQTRVTTDDNLARNWGLSTDEWSRYQQLMKGPLGIYSPQLDPLTALGIEARSDEERRRYAELQVQAEARRVEKILVYQRAYDAAWKRLYPTATPVTPASPFRPVAVQKKRQP